MISETAYTQFPGPLYCQKGSETGADINGPYGAEKGIMFPSSVDPRVSMTAGAFKAGVPAVKSLLEGRKNVGGLAVSNFQAAASSKVKASVLGK
mmetsp:Transcript_33548/g.99931  ORF Transcript_33548/g.99931 Transcript_33548/m.99931 type:complete len:94 (-) Transcript_33548:92-373(-)